MEVEGIHVEMECCGEEVWNVEQLEGGQGPGGMKYGVLNSFIHSYI